MEIEETFKLLDEGKTEIVLDNAHRDNVIMLGNTGSGKSTLTLFIAADNSKLIAEETTPGSGDYTINDNDLIGNSTAESKTLFPNLIVDPQTNVGYYDCPGFLDTRNSSYDIASTYFTKEVMDFSQTVKLAFVVNHSAVKIGNDRQDFQTLVQHIVTMVKDAAKFAEATSLIATKVENKYVFNPKTQQLELVPDETVINTIGAFLLEFKTSLENGKVYPEDPELQKKALKFVNVLLYQTNNVYSRIGIFRVPDRPGPLANNPFLQENRKKLIKLISDDTKFVAKGENDFGYTISDKTQNTVIKLVDELNKRITNASNKISGEIQQFYEDQIANSINIYTLPDTLNSGYKVWSAIVDEAADITSPEEYLAKIVDAAHKSTLELNNKILQHLSDQNGYFKSFEQISGKKQEIKPLTWVTGLKPAVTFAQRSMNWYHFLINLFDKLSTFKFQQDPSLYNVADPSNWGQSGRPQGIEITNANIKAFLEKITDEKIDGYSNIKDLSNFSKSELRDLGTVLDVTLIQRPTPDCKSGDKLIVKGNFVKMSYVAQIQCSNIKKIEILALHAFFVDADLERKFQKFQVGVIAPTWEVTRSATISLAGQAGGSQDKPGKNGGGRGLDGKPGQLGQNGGTFFGIGKKFVGGDSLMINTEGGAGGGGQAGGDGGDGNRGTDAALPPKRKWFNTDLYFYSVGDLKFRYKLTDTKTGMMGSGVFYIDSYYDVYGDHANGDNGGDGGVGGLGGNGGIVTMVELDGASGIRKTSNQGARGSGGAGGKGGSPGTDGDSLKTVLSQIGNLPPSSWVVKSRQAGAKSSRGSDGSNNHNQKGLIQPDPSLDYDDRQGTMTDYENYLKTHLQNSVQQQPLNEFLKELNKSRPTRSFILSEKPQIQRYKRGIENSAAEDKFVASSATKSSSAINNFFEWFQTTTDNLIGSIGGWFSELPSLRGPGDTSNHLSGSYYYDLNSTLILADLLVRRFTNEKSFLPQESSLSVNEVQGLVLELLGQFQEELEKLGLSNEFDPVSVQSQLMSLVINEKYSKIFEVLGKSVEMDCETQSRIMEKIGKLLEREIGNLKRGSLSACVNPVPEMLYSKVIKDVSIKIGGNSDIYLQ